MMKIGFIPALIFVMSVAASSRASATKIQSCGIAISANEVIDLSVADLAQLRLRLDFAKAKGNNSLADTALNHEFDIKQTQLEEALSLLGDSRSVKSLIQEQIQRIQNFPKEDIPPEEDIRAREANSFAPVVIDEIPGISYAIFNGDGKNAFMISKNGSFKNLELKSRNNEKIAALGSKAVSLELNRISGDILIEHGKSVNGLIYRASAKPNQENLEDVGTFTGGAITFSQDQREIYARGFGEIQILDAESLDKIHEIPFNKSAVKFMAVSKARFYVLTSESSSKNKPNRGRIYFFGSRNQTETNSFWLDERADMAQVSPDESIMVVGSIEGAKVYALPDGELIAQLKLPKQYVTAIGFTPDGEKFFIGSTTGRITFFNTRTRKKTEKLELGSPVESFSTSPDGRYLLAATDGLKIIDLFGLKDTKKPAAVGK